jgi:spore germination protein YaaH
MDKNKLLLGVPWYGYKFGTESNARLSSINGDVNYVSYKNYVGTINNYTKKWDPVWQTPWYTYKDNDSQWYQIHYEDIRSSSIKYDLVKSEGLGGIGIWAINFGTDVDELWQLIQDKFR